MRVTDLDFRELLQPPSDSGLLRFGGERCVIFDAVALGLLRRELIEALGQEVARGLLTRFGYAHGWRTAATLRDAFPWDDPREWRQAGGRFHELQGFVKVEGQPDQGRDGGPFAHAIWRDSYEAEQHLLHLGRAEGCVCWTLTGFASGYMSLCNEREILCIERRCVARGDAVCEIEGRPRADWQGEHEAHLPYYRADFLDATLCEVTRSLREAEARLEARRRELGEDDLSEDGLVARSAAMRGILELADRAARLATTVLITGESGVGKERLAQAIHARSPRSRGPFLAVNCGAIPETLIESELFGHARGAFTGADRDRIGLFESAQGGTLLLDEVGELPLQTQVKLLRVLQERELRRVGENTTRPVDARIIAATNRDLKDEVSAGRFREDLYYRLRVIELKVPPLRERREDILPLARDALLRIAERLGCPAHPLSPEAADQLLRYPWPGNVRELHNALEHGLVVARGERIELGDLPEDLRHGRPIASPDSRLEELERDAILRALEEESGHRARAAERLGIGVATLYRKLRRYRDEGTLPEGL